MTVPPEGLCGDSATAGFSSGRGFRGGGDGVRIGRALAGISGFHEKARVLPWDCRLT